MKEEFDLSKEITDSADLFCMALSINKVKEFIRRLKEEIKSHIAGSEKFYDDNPENLLDFINKLTGEKLNERRNPQEDN